MSNFPSGHSKRFSFYITQSDETLGQIKQRQSVKKTATEGEKNMETVTHTIKHTNYETNRHKESWKKGDKSKKKSIKIERRHINK